MAPIKIDETQRAVAAMVRSTMLRYRAYAALGPWHLQRSDSGLVLSPVQS